MQMFRSEAPDANTPFRGYVAFQSANTPSELNAADIEPSKFYARRRIIQTPPGD